MFYSEYILMEPFCTQSEYLWCFHVQWTSSITPSTSRFAQSKWLVVSTIDYDCEFFAQFFLIYHVVFNAILTFLCFLFSALKINLIKLMNQFRYCIIYYRFLVSQMLITRTYKIDGAIYLLQII